MSKNDTRSRDWLLTIPLKDCSVEQLEAGMKRYRWVGQLERGEKSGYDHWQVAIFGKNAIQFSTLKRKFPTAHLEVRRGSQREAFDYVTKEETRVAGPYGAYEELDELVTDVAGQGGRSDLARVRDGITLLGKSVNELILDGTASSPAAVQYANMVRQALLKERFGNELRRELEVFYLSGPTGVGKSRMLFEKYDPKDVFTVNSYDHPFDTYDGERVLVLDEFRSQLPISEMLKILDIYPMLLPARYVDRQAAFLTVWVVSNWGFARQYQNVQVDDHSTWQAFQRRFTKIYRMNSNGLLVEQNKDGHDLPEIDSNGLSGGDWDPDMEFAF